MSDTCTVIPQSEFKNHPLLSRLLELHSPPKQLYLRGDLPEITLDEYGRASPRILTVIGSRRHTTYGKSALAKLISGLKDHDVIILSGLAIGIDGLAHKTAIANNMTTLAIPGSGLDQQVLYPRTHQALGEEIIATGGTLLSELAPTTRPAPWTFPQRNRIMAALSDALLIVEAEEKSGTLITARQALELGKDIGAIPGEIFSPTSSGTNMLIHEGAYPITSISDILSLLHLSETVTPKTAPQAHFTEAQKVILDLLREPLDKDTLLAKSNLSFEEFLSAFSELELDGYIEETFGEVRSLV